MRRILAFWLAMLLCGMIGLHSAAAETMTAGKRALVEADPMDRVFSQLTFVSQHDSRYQTKRYWYDSAQFSAQGCGPAAVTNAMIALLRVDDQETTDGFLLEMMWMLCNNVFPRNRMMDIRHLANVWNATAERAPIYLGLLEKMGIDNWQHTDEEALSLESLSEQVAASAAADEPAVFTTGFYSQTQCRELAELLCMLYDEGLDEAEVILTYVTGGTENTSGPFRTGDGHYITLLFPVGRWMTEGGYYLIDSNPRALDEELTRNSIYWKKYPFVTNYNCREFRQTWVASRIRSTCVRFDWTEEKQAEMADLWAEHDRDTLVTAYQDELTMLGLYGKGVLMIRLPGAD